MRTEEYPQMYHDTWNLYNSPICNQGKDLSVRLKVDIISLHREGVFNENYFKGESRILKLLRSDFPDKATRI